MFLTFDPKSFKDQRPYLWSGQSFSFALCFFWKEIKRNQWWLGRGKFVVVLGSHCSPQKIHCRHQNSYFRQLIQRRQFFQHYQWTLTPHECRYLLYSRLYFLQDQFWWSNLSRLLLDQFCIIPFIQEWDCPLPRPDTFQYHKRNT